jgi:hypothetical protein
MVEHRIAAVECRGVALEMIVRALIQAHPDLAAFYAQLESEIEAMKMHAGATTANVELLEITVRKIVAPNAF